MNKRHRLLIALFLAASTSAGILADENRLPVPVELPGQGILFATPLLSEAEQADYRARIRAAADGSERERIRTAHYELMKSRASERGFSLPERRPSAVGEVGSSFGPQLITEDERAARRARSRSAGSEPAAHAGNAPRTDQAVGAILPGPQRSARANDLRADDAQPHDRVKVVTPIEPPAKSTEPIPGAVVLSGLEAIFGPQLMSEDERAGYRSRLRSAKSDGERQSIRAERDAQLRSSAKQKGITLPP